jgi:two-component system nitrogen regulation sensor histidine kinase NtrY
MSFRRKLLIFFALTSFLSIGAVTWFVISVTRNSFEQINNDQTAALLSQFRREFDRKGEDISQRVQAAAASETATRIALALGRGAPDYGKLIHDAQDLAESQRLDFLEIVEAEGTVLSSAQSPARFGYKDPSLPASLEVTQPILREEQPATGSVLALEVIRSIRGGEKPLFVIGGAPMDAKFLSSLDVPSGMSAALYQSSSKQLTPLPAAHSGIAASPERLKTLVDEAIATHRNATISLENNEIWHAIPLAGGDGSVPAVLLIGSSRQPYLELRQHITSVAIIAASAGVFLAIIFSSIISRSVTRPIEQLETAARDVSSGNWHARVPVTSADELGRLAESFNRMTSELLSQRDRLVQAERVAAWRELARRLAHELKNPLFPLQLTVENLLRAKQRSPQEFGEVFAESSTTLLAEIANLKNIVSRFGEFSRMPQPAFQSVNVNRLMTDVARLFQAQLSERSRIHCEMKLDPSVPQMAADPDLLHRALSNLILNAIDAMPDGGTLTLSTRRAGDGVRLEVADTGSGLTPEERGRLFTPYYTSKAHGTGLGLAIVQSIVSDHQGTIGVQSQPDKGSVFQIELPANLDKLQPEPVRQTAGTAG